MLEQAYGTLATWGRAVVLLQRATNHGAGSMPHLFTKYFLGPPVAELVLVTSAALCLTATSAQRFLPVGST